MTGHIIPHLPILKRPFYKINTIALKFMKFFDFSSHFSYNGLYCSYRISTYLSKGEGFYASTHINDQGRARMVDVSEKAITHRIAVAAGSIYMQPETLQAIIDGQIKKGDVLAVAQVAGIMAAKQTSSIIPMCHPLMLSGIDIHFETDTEENAVHIKASVKTTGQTGVEMEALHAVSAAALTIYDMCKAIDRGMHITNLRVIEKDGGKSGHFTQQ